jgi:hypothetical protein
VFDEPVAYSVHAQLASNVPLRTFLSGDGHYRGCQHEEAAAAALPAILAIRKNTARLAGRYAHWKSPKVKSIVQ